MKTIKTTAPTPYMIKLLIIDRFSRDFESNSPASSYSWKRGRTNLENFKFIFFKFYYHVNKKFVQYIILQII